MLRSQLMTQWLNEIYETFFGGNFSRKDGKKCERKAIAILWTLLAFLLSLACAIKQIGSILLRADFSAISEGKCVF